MIRAGRHHIAKTLLERGVAKLDPLSPENPLIFSAEPFTGSGFSNANRLSVGCKSPRTGGVKESSVGGTFAFALGQLEIAGLTLDDASADRVVIRITKFGVPLQRSPRAQRQGGAAPQRGGESAPARAARRGHERIELEFSR